MILIAKLSLEISCFWNSTMNFKTYLWKDSVIHTRQISIFTRVELLSSKIEIFFSEEN